MSKCTPSSAAQVPVTLTQQHTVTVQTTRRGPFDITPQLASIVAESAARIGVLQVFCHHTSCSLLITENADPDVHADIERFLARLVPDGDSLFKHDSEGPDDMPAHIRAALTATALSIPISHGRLALGTWQGVYLWEHRLRPHTRRLTVTLLGSE